MKNIIVPSPRGLWRLGSRNPRRFRRRAFFLIEQPVDLSTGGVVVLVEDADNTVESDISGTGGSSTTTIYMVQIDCTKNPGENVYARLWNKATTPTIGTDDCELVLPGARGKINTWVNWRGVPFTSKVHVACVTDPGGTGGVTSPTGKVDLRVLLVTP